MYYDTIFSSAEQVKRHADTMSRPPQGSLWMQTHSKSVTVGTGLTMRLNFSYCEDTVGQKNYSIYKFVHRFKHLFQQIVAIFLLFYCFFEILAAINCTYKCHRNVIGKVLYL